MARDKEQIGEIKATHGSDDLIHMLQQTYQHFNNRNIDATLAAMDPDVHWPNGIEGGVEHGVEAVRNYWTNQWALLNPRVEPIAFHFQEDGRINVTVHQVVHDSEGKLLVDHLIHHIYTIDKGLITIMEIQQE